MGGINVGPSPSDALRCPACEHSSFNHVGPFNYLDPTMYGCKVKHTEEINGMQRLIVCGCTMTDEEMKLNGADSFFK